MTTPVWAGPSKCFRCGALIRAAEPGHELDSTSHGICEACLPVWREELGLEGKPPQEARGE